MIITLDMMPPTRTWQAALCPLKNRKTGKFFVGKKASDPVKKALKELEMCLLPHRPLQPLTGAIYCILELVYPYRKSEKRSLVQSGVLIPKTTTPDADNAAKGILDTMTKLGFWEDDARIYELSIRKYWGPEQMIRIRYGSSCF